MTEPNVSDAEHDVQSGQASCTDTVGITLCDEMPRSEQQHKKYSAVVSALTEAQKRALTIFTLVALLFGAYFLRGYFVLIVGAAVSAYLLTPLFNQFRAHFRPAVSAILTLLSALACVIIPISLLVGMAVAQITQIVGSTTNWFTATDLGALGDKALRSVNALLARVPFFHTTVTTGSLRKSLEGGAQQMGEWFLHLAQATAGSVVSTVVWGIIFLYVFVSLLLNRDKVLDLIRHLNPLGEDITDVYLSKVGAMVRAAVGGQFVIALCQGVVAAASIYIAGFHHAFFIFVILLTALSIIPLGAGIVTIPFGIAFILFGNVGGGIFVILWHLLVVTTLDEFLRPLLVPRQARLDSGLMLLAVFAGVSMFGFAGVVIGPVLMIIIVTTISVYLAVYRGIPMREADDAGPRRRRWIWHMKPSQAQ